jgi:hypothetical protein
MQEVSAVQQLVCRLLSQCNKLPSAFVSPGRTCTAVPLRWWRCVPGISLLSVIRLTPRSKGRLAASRNPPLTSNVKHIRPGNQLREETTTRMSTPTLHEPKAESKTSFGTVVFCWLTVFVAFVEGMLLLIAEGKMSTYSGGVAAASGLAAIASAFTAPFVARSKTWLMAILLVLFGLAFINRNFLKYVLVTL